MMNDNTSTDEFIFSSEEKTIKNAEEALKQPESHENKLSEPFATLLNSYKKLFKQTKNLIKMSDRRQKQIFQLNEELAETNRLLLSGEKGGKNLTINFELIKKISDLSSYLVLTKNQIISATEQGEHSQDFLQLLQNFSTSINDLQDTILQTRMQPLGLLFSSIPKIIHRTNRKLKKDINLEISGEKIFVDNRLFDSLDIILKELVKNACLHGIETNQNRLKKGKDAMGLISIKAMHKKRKIKVLLTDDGQGFDPKIIEDNLFSNLHMVKTMIDEIGGLMEIQSKKDVGTEFLLEFPETRTIASAVIVESDGDRYIIPQNSVEEFVSLYNDEIFLQIEQTQEQEVYRLRDKLIPIIRLNEILMQKNPFTKENRIKIVEKYRGRCNYLKKQDNQSDTILYFAVLKTPAGHFGLIVDEIIGTEEIIFMHIHSAVANIKIFDGISILGDGSVSTILNPEGIYNHAGISINPSLLEQKVQNIKNTKLQRLFIFKCGNKEQFAVHLKLIQRVVRIKKEDIQYKGDTPYVAIDGSVMRLIMLDTFLNVSTFNIVDPLYVMIPRNFNKQVAFLISNLGFIYHTEINFEKNRPFEEGIKGTMKIDNTITLFIDIPFLIQLVKT